MRDSQGGGGGQDGGLCSVALKGFQIRHEFRLVTLSGLSISTAVRDCELRSIFADVIYGHPLQFPYKTNLIRAPM